MIDWPLTLFWTTVVAAGLGALWAPLVYRKLRSATGDFDITVGGRPLSITIDAFGEATISGQVADAGVVEFGSHHADEPLSLTRIETGDPNLDNRTAFAAAEPARLIAVLSPARRNRLSLITYGSTALIGGHLQSTIGQVAVKRAARERQVEPLIELVDNLHAWLAESIDVPSSLLERFESDPLVRVRREAFRHLATACRGSQQHAAAQQRLFDILPVTEQVSLLHLLDDPTVRRASVAILESSDVDDQDALTAIECLVARQEIPSVCLAAVRERVNATSGFIAGNMLRALRNNDAGFGAVELRGFINRSDDNVVREALAQVVHLDEAEALPLLVRAAEHWSRDIWHPAINQLIERGGSNAIAAARGLLADDQLDGDERAYLRKRLSQIADTGGLSVAGDALMHKSGGELTVGTAVAQLDTAAEGAAIEEVEG